MRFHREEGITLMKMFALMTLILCATSLTALAAGIDGKWISETQVGDADGKTYAHTSTFTFKNDGGSLGGTLVQVCAAPWMIEMNGRVLDVIDGKLEGDKFSFKVKLDTRQGEKTAVYEGTLADDQLKGIIKYRGIGITRPFEARRAN